LTEDILTFSFNKRLISARQGDTISAALWRNGIRIITRSLKFHRPRGLYCGNGDCPNCLANVNGIPNVRTCTTLAENGMQVTMQNKFLSMRIDPIVLMDHLFPTGFNYHHRFIRPRFMTGVYQSTLRRMTGIGKLPTETFQAKPTKKMKCDAIIIGGEPQSLKIASILADEKFKIVVINAGGGPESTHHNDDNSKSIINLADSIADDLSKRKNVEIIWKANVVGAFDDGSVGIASKDRLYICKSNIISLSERSREQPVRFINWDLPGIIQGTAASRLLDRDISLGKRVVITGEQDNAIDLGELMINKGINVTAILCQTSDDPKKTEKLSKVLKSRWKVHAAIGRNELKKIIVTDGSKQETLQCDCLVTCGPSAPNIDLARQLGCEIRANGKSFPFVAVNESFETTRSGVFAVGSICGIRSTSESWESASKAGKTIADKLRGMGE